MNENKNKVINYAQDFGALIALILLMAGISIASPSFRTGANFLSLLRQSSINGLIAFGMTFVILTDAIDLSVGSVLALSTALCAGMITAGVPAGLAMILALVLGCAMGVISGVMVTKGRLQPFIATLITMTVYRGLTMIYTNGKPISNLGDSFILKVVGKGKFYGVPIPVILLIFLFLLFYFLLNKTTFGRRIYATGSNWKSAKLAGVNIHRTKIIAYAISGTMAALSGLILLSRLGSAQPTLGSGYELDAIAAVALGGTSMSGGKGTLWGTIIGVFLVGFLRNALNILGVNPYWQGSAIGAVIVVAVLAEKLSKLKLKKNHH